MKSELWEERVLLGANCWVTPEKPPVERLRRAAPPYWLWSIPFIAPSGLPGDPSSWGSLLQFLRSSEGLAERRPIVLSIPLR